VQDIPLVVRRIGSLCAALEADSDLRELLDEGIARDFWTRIVEAVRQGATEKFPELLNELEKAAADGGLDGITIETREYKPLPPFSPGVRTVGGWRCPHARPCGRVEVGPDQPVEPGCELTGDPLAQVHVTSV
jgi:hypothetical protein